MIGKIDATVLFVQDLAKCVAFYRDTIGLEVATSDDNSVAFRLQEEQYLVVLKVSAAAEMVGEEAMSLHGGSRSHQILLCTGVENVDDTYKVLTDKGVNFIKPPKDQAWGRRTAYFADPEGNLWEIWQNIE
jgi:lactoylglutathione lyase